MILRHLTASVLAGLLFSSTLTAAPFFPGVEIVQQDRTQIAFDNMMSELTRVHKAVFTLPYEYEYIKGTLMPQVEAKRLEIAPHWPDRSQYGDDTVLGRQLFKEWYISYPGESTAYIAFVDQFVQQHSK